MQVHAVIQKCFHFRDSAPQNRIQLDIYRYKFKLNQFKQDTENSRSPFTLKLWLERPDFPTQHATQQNFHRAGSQECCQGSGEHLEGLKEAKWRWLPRVRVCIQLSPATSWEGQFQHPSSLTSSHRQGPGLHEDLTPQPQPSMQARS